MRKPLGPDMLISTKYGIIALAVGLICILIGGLMLFLADDIVRAGQRIHPNVGGDDLLDWDAWKTQIQLIYGFTTLIGLACLIAAFGLSAGMEWARKLWLALATVLFIFHTTWFLFDRSEWISAMIALAIATCSWVDLTKGQAKTFFQRP